jgi:hypothetical protein
MKPRPSRANRGKVNARPHRRPPTDVCEIEDAIIARVGIADGDEDFDPGGRLLTIRGVR